MNGAPLTIDEGALIRNSKIAPNFGMGKAETNKKIFNGIRQALIEQGETGDIDAIASAAVNTMTGAPLTEVEKELIKNSKMSPFATDDKEVNDSITATAKMYEAAGVSPEQALEMAKEQFPDSTIKVTSSEQNATEGKYEVSDDGKTVNTKTGDAVEVVNISSISDSGEVGLTLKDGTVIKASDVSFGNPAEAAFVGYISELKLGKNVISAETANDLYQAAMSALSSNPDMTVSEASSLIRGLAEAYTYGAYNFGEERLTETDENGKAKRFAGELTETQRKFAYKLGAKDRDTRIEAEQKSVDEAKKKAKPNKKHFGKVVFENGINVNESDLSDFQKANLEGIKLLAEISSIEFHIYQTENVDGKWQYTMADGTVVGANGWYVAGTNEIWVDLNAGEFGEGAMIRTAAHEISHYIKEKSPKQWQAMADLLMQTFAENAVDVESMLNRQIAKIKRRYKSNKETVPSQSVLREMAYEELVCDALSDMLTDGSIVNFISEVKAKDQKLGKRILEAIKNLLKKWGLVVDSYKGKDLDTAEAQALSQFEDTFKKLQEMYRDAFMDANEVYAQTKEKFDEESILYSERKQRINNTVDKAINQKGNLGEKYNQVQISKFPSDISKFVSIASEGKINLDGKYVALNGDNIWHEYKRHSDISIEADRQQLPFTAETIKDAILAIYEPDIVESVFSTSNNPTQRQSFAYAKKSPNGYYIVVEAVGGRRNPNVVPVMLLQFTEEKWNDMISSGVTLGELLFENDAEKRNSLDVELNKKNRVTVAQFASKEAIANTPRSPQFDDIVPQHDNSVKRQSCDRDSDSISTRSLLANALEGAVQNDIERKKLAQYKEKIALLDSEQQKLSEIQKQLFTKGAVDSATRKKLQLEAKQISNRINIYDRQLLNLEATTALKNVLEREKTRARKKQKEIDNKILQGQKDKATAKPLPLYKRFFFCYSFFGLASSSPFLL